MPAAHINVDEFLANYPRYLNRPGGKILSGTDSYKTYCSAIRQFLEWCDARAIIPLEVDDYQAGEYIDWIESSIIIRPTPWLPSGLALVSSMRPPSGCI